jgi:hypothetical protein
MKTTIKIPVFILSMILLSANCRREDEGHKKILVINNSDDPIYFDNSLRYPDTLTLYPNPAIDPGYFKINAHLTENDISRGYYEDKILTNTYGKIMYFIYDAQTLETTPWDTVVKKYMILKRYDLTKKDLDSLGWKITYP